MRTISWGIVGTGFITDTVCRAIKEAPHNQLSAVCGSSHDKAQDFARQHGIIDTYDKLDDMLKCDNIDVIYLSLPNDLHAEWVERCAKAGKHVLCEKPFTVTADETRHVIKALEQNQVFCMEALMYSCHPLSTTLNSLLTSRRVGAIHAIDAHYSCDIFDIANSFRSGAILSLGCYPLSLALRTIKANGHDDNPCEIRASGVIDANKKIDMCASLLLDFPHGASVNISCSNRLEMASNFRISGKKGDIVIPGNPWLPNQHETIEIRDRHGNKDIIQIEADYSVYCYEILEAARCIRDHKTQSPIIPLQHSLQLMQLMDQWRHQIGLYYDIEQAVASTR